MIPTIDIHNHPGIKPFGYSQGNPADADDQSNPGCLWYSDKVNKVEEKLDDPLAFPLYRQSDFTKMVKGNIAFSIAAMGPIEKGFFDLKSEFLDRLAGNKLINLVSGVGETRVRQIRQDDFNYWEDFKKEHQFMDRLNGKIPKGGDQFYRILKSGSELDHLGDTADILIGLSLEGCHSFCNGNKVEDPQTWAGLEDRVAEVKSWPSRILFASLAHHFYNGLCSHAQSIFGMLPNLIKGQKRGMSTLAGISPTEITGTGRLLIDLLYSESNGPRILVDIKHFSAKAKHEFYAYRAEKGYEHIPILASHAGCWHFYKEEVNLKNEDIVQVVKSGGIIGLELDERIMGHDIEHLRPELEPADSLLRKPEFASAVPIWNNLIHIAETAHFAGFTEDPWQYICLGSDYDGIINAMDRYITAAQIQQLWVDLAKLLDYYWSLPDSLLKKPAGLEAGDVMAKIAFGNAKAFIQRNF